jgi:hypothetical protein
MLVQHQKNRSLELLNKKQIFSLFFLCEVFAQNVGHGDSITLRMALGTNLHNRQCLNRAV